MCEECAVYIHAHKLLINRVRLVQVEHQVPKETKEIRCIELTPEVLVNYGV